MTTKEELERVAQCFARMLREQGLAATLNYVNAVETGLISLPKGIQMTKEEFVECGRTGCEVLLDKAFKTPG